MPPKITSHTVYYVCMVIDSEAYLECVANGHYIIE